jgi:hypothetical protein
MPGPTTDLDRPVTMPALVYLDEGDQVTIGRPDTDCYAVFPPEGAELVRRLAAGMAPSQAAQWYADSYGEPVDIAGLLADLADLDLLGAGAAEPAGPPRFQRLGQLALSRPALLGYGLIVLAGVFAVIRQPALAPSYRQLFFTRYFAVVQIVGFLGQFPLMLVHEAAHALAGRRLGLKTRLSVGFRFYFVVLETAMDGLVSVPRRRRVLPMLAGMGADLVVVALLTLTAWALRTPAGIEPLPGRIALALAYATLLRVAWQFDFFLRTDLYYLISLVLNCVDLHGTAMAMLRNRVARLRRRPDLLVDESNWHRNDIRAGRWYAWLVVIGYLSSLVVLVVGVLPAGYRFLSGVLGQLNGSGGTGGLLDAAVFLTLNLAQVLVIAAFAVHRRRLRKAAARPVPAVAFVEPAVLA